MIILILIMNDGWSWYIGSIVLVSGVFFSIEVVFNFYRYFYVLVIKGKNRRNVSSINIE